MISKNLPSKTKIIAGGPVFAADRGFAARAGIHFAAKNAAYFIQYLLQFEKKVTNNHLPKPKPR